MTRYSMEPRTRKYVKGFGEIGRNPCSKYRKQLIDVTKNTGIDALKTVTKKVAHKAA